MSVLDELERFLAKYDSPAGATWDEGKDFQVQLESAAPALHRPVGTGRPSSDEQPTLTIREGKKAAGRLLDGREHNEFPQAGRAGEE